VRCDSFAIVGMQSAPQARPPSPRCTYEAGDKRQNNGDLSAGGRSIPARCLGRYRRRKARRRRYMRTATPEPCLWSPIQPGASERVGRLVLLFPGPMGRLAAAHTLPAFDVTAGRSRRAPRLVSGNGRHYLRFAVPTAPPAYTNVMVVAGWGPFWWFPSVFSAPRHHFVHARSFGWSRGRPYRAPMSCVQASWRNDRDPKQGGAH
jgi:hypothetical protein